jgi:hemolysin activation/secretion protein
MRGIAITCLSAISITGFTVSASAQSIPPAGVTIPPNTPQRVEETIPKPTSPTPAPSPTPEPPRILEVPNASPPTQAPGNSNVRFQVKKVEVLGNTVLKDEIAKIIEEGKYENSERTFEELIELRSKITQRYIEKGYVTSGAFLVRDKEEQNRDNYTVRIQVVEGGLEKIEITGLSRLQEGYIRSRLASASSTPLNVNRLREALQLLQLDPVLEKVEAELTAGKTPGRNILALRLKEAPAFHADLVVANNQSPSVGSIQASVSLSHNNLLGFGDRFTAEYGLTRGLNLYGLSYTVPINSNNGTFGVRYSNNNSKITEEPFDDLGIRSDSETLSFSLRQPIVRKPQTEFAVGLGLDLRRSQTFILDDTPFSFSEGAEDGKSKVTAIRFFQDWVKRDATQVLAARSQFNFGIDAFDATTNNSGTDGRFFSWVGQFQWVKQVSSRNTFIARIDAQLTPDSLLSLERFSLGGVNSIRGYRQNQIASDNGVLASAELRIPLTSDPRTLQLTPFVEFGGGWNNRGQNPEPGFIASFGTNLRWQISPSFDLTLDYGIPIIAVKDGGNSLQDNGFYFSLRYRPF